MSLAKVRAALESRLTAMTPALSTAFENASFSPVSGTPYQAVYLLPAQPDDSEIGARHHFEIGIFQVSLLYPQNTGPAAAQSRAIAVRQWFSRGTTLTNAGVNVNITRVPYIRPGRVDADRWRIDIDIRYQAEIFA